MRGFVGSRSVLKRLAVTLVVVYFAGSFTLAEEDAVQGQESETTENQPTPAADGSEGENVTPAPETPPPTETPPPEETPTGPTDNNPTDGSGDSVQSARVNSTEKEIPREQSQRPSNWRVPNRQVVCRYETRSPLLCHRGAYTTDDICSRYGGYYYPPSPCYPGTYSFDYSRYPCWNPRYQQTYSYRLGTSCPYTFTRPIPSYPRDGSRIYQLYGRCR
ncbi:hypothetical protein RUM43_014214 [Polyplax serrata]|uniref:Uncharacterized protein n=1 Tax=Polyplax serrata TaxID=468196 RepID=A0AAN8PQY1_POLSC